MSNDVKALAAANAEVRTEIARVDGKAAALASIATLLMTVGTAGLVTIELPSAASAVGWAAVVAVAAAIWLLVAAIKPSLNAKNAAPGGPLSWRNYTAEEALDLCRAGNAETLDYADAAQMVFLSDLAYRKWRCVRLACYMLLAGLAAGVGTGALAVLL